MPAPGSTVFVPRLKGRFKVRVFKHREISAASGLAARVVTAGRPQTWPMIESTAL